MFVTDSDFEIQPYILPVSTDAPNVLSDMIPVAEQKILKSLLGSALYADFLEGILVDVEAEEPVMKEDADIDEKWLALRDGAFYEVDGVEYEYEGLANFLKPYICQEYLSRNSKTLSGLGAQEVEVENANLVNSSDLISEYWAEFVKYIGDCEEEYDTFYGFMKSAYEEDYANWRFEHPGSKNDFDL